MEQPETHEHKLDVIIKNVVASFKTSCRLDLKTIARKGFNVREWPGSNFVTMQLRKPRVTATIWHSGKIICFGARSENNAKVGCRRIARVLQKLGFEVKFCAFKVVNMMGVCQLPFRVILPLFIQQNRAIVSYNPEIFSGAIWRMEDLKSTVKVNPSGFISLTGSSVEKLVAAMKQAYLRCLQCSRPKQDVSKQCL